jgi:hypothetical protein
MRHQSPARNSPTRLSSKAVQLPKSKHQYMFAPFLGVGIAQNPDLRSQSRIVHRGSANKECAYGNLSAFDDPRVSLRDVSRKNSSRGICACVQIARRVELFRLA